MSKTPTPRTDAASTYRDGTWECVNANFARLLEREVEEAQKELHNWKVETENQQRLKLASQLREQKMREAITDYLKHPSSDGKQPERAEKRGLLKTLSTTPTDDSLLREVRECLEAAIKHYERTDVGSGYTGLPDYLWTIHSRTQNALQLLGGGSSHQPIPESNDDPQRTKHDEQAKSD